MHPSRQKGSRRGRALALVSLVGVLSLGAGPGSHASSAEDGAPAAAAPSTSVAQLPPNYVAVGLPDLGGDGSVAYAINDLGQIVGAAEVADGTMHAAMWDGETVIDVGADLGDGDSWAYDVNADGHVVGAFETPTGDRHAFWWDAGASMDLGTFGGPDSVAESVNEAGIVAGWAQDDPKELPVAFRWDANAPGALVPVGSTLGGLSTWARAINADGDVVGYSTLEGGLHSHAALWRASTTTPVDLGSFDGDSSAAADINDAGAVVGTSGGSRAFVWTESDGMRPLLRLSSAPAATAARIVERWSYATALNERGEVVGAEETLGGEAADTRAFLWRADIGMILLPSPAGYSRVEASDINERGEIVGGASGDLLSTTAVVWVPPPDFLDVSVAHPFVDDIGWMAGEGIAEGYPDGGFHPNAPVTRQAMAAFFYRFAGEPAFVPPAMPTFSDVPQSHPFFAEIEWLAAEGVAEGYLDGGFHPNAPVTRQSMAAFLYRLAGEPAFVAPATPTFSDVGLSHPFFLEIEWSADVGIAQGFDDGTYRPGNAMRRSATAAFLHRFVPVAP